MMAQGRRRSALHEIAPDSMGESGGLAFRLVVSPAAGRMRHLPPKHFLDGVEWVEKGQTVAVIEQGSTEIDVRSPIEGRVEGILVRDGEPVLPGQPLVWLDEARRARTEPGGGP